MFDTGYPFNQINRKDGVNDGHICTWFFNFNTEQRRYIVEVELYDLNIYVLKYYADCHSRSKNKYRFILNEGKASKIIRTCIDIMLHFYNLNPLASFGFVGINSHGKIKKGKKVKESITNTQRFRIYKRVMSNFFGKETFSHSRTSKYSAYLMINRKCKGIRAFKAEAQKMFSKIYLNFLIQDF